MDRTETVDDRWERSARVTGAGESSTEPDGSPALHAAEDAVLAVIRERHRQDGQWGEQNHDAGTWALILLEEIGEWARSELHARFGGPDADNAHTEAVHMTAVALAVIECMNRKANEKAEG